MPRLTIDGRLGEAPPGHTILQAAEALGIDIPTLCYLEDLRPNTSCMVCVVEVAGRSGLVPACAAPVEEGMEVRTDTAVVREARRTALELLLSTHVGDCCAPCQHTCPLHLDIPRMLSQIAAGDLTGAEETVRSAMAMPAVLARVCPQLCERTCRRGLVDRAAAICELKRQVAEAHQKRGMTDLPARRSARGKRVAIVGGGPAGLSAAYHLLLEGYECMVYERRECVGGRLRIDFDEAVLPAEILSDEISLIARLGAEVRTGVTITEADLPGLRAEFNAVLIATGRLGPDAQALLGLPTAAGRVRVSGGHETSLPGVFAAGDCVRFSDLVVRSVADGKSAAQSIHASLTGVRESSHAGFQFRTGRVTREEIVSLTLPGAATTASSKPVEAAPARSLAAAEAEAARCLHCDCAARDRCRLRRYAEEYAVSTTRSGPHRHALKRVGSDGVVFEPGKCILCGICIQIAAEEEEPVGLSFVGRGFDTRLGVPFGGSFSEGLQRSARRCIEACPTGALSQGPPPVSQPHRTARRD